MSNDSVSKAHIVIIDDDDLVCASYVDELVWGYGFNKDTIICFTDPRIALSYLTENLQQVDVILLDLKMPHIDGLDMLRNIRNLDKVIKIIIISAFASIKSVKTAVKSEEEAMILAKSVDKPVTDFKLLSHLILDAYQERRGHHE